MNLTLSDIKGARRRIAPYIHETDITKVILPGGQTLHIKAENLQTTGSFKVRGATNRILQMSYEEKKNGVIASSAGNHAQGVAIAARNAGIQCTIVMPRTAPLSKIAATESYGAKVVLEGIVFDDAYQKAREIQEETGATFVHAFDDDDVIAGQGTVALEIIDQFPEVEQIVVPVGGGGLIAGIALAAKSIRPDISIVGVEPLAAASMYQSLAQNKIITLESANTMADGIAVKTPGVITYELCKEYVDEIVTVDEGDIASAILFMIEKAKIISEGAGAATVAAAMTGKISTDKPTVAVLSGGNIDVTMIPRIIDKGLVRAGRKILIRTQLGDKPGQLSQLLTLVSSTGANVVSIRHDRLDVKIPLNCTVVELELETRGRSHSEEIVALLEQNDHPVDMLS